MSNMRTSIANDPMRFGRRVRPAPIIEARPQSIGDDLRLFAMTFAAGFLFFTIFLG
jgi:hypothetical protein